VDRFIDGPKLSKNWEHPELTARSMSILHSTILLLLPLQSALFIFTVALGMVTASICKFIKKMDD